MKNLIRRHATIAAVVVVSACSGDHSALVAPTSPGPVAHTPAPSATPLPSLLSATGSLVSVTGLQRTTPLATPITVTKTMGVDGGTLSIPQAGVTVTVPRGALKATTTITMTARAGSLVAYDFAPHGITFLKPLAFTQQLRGTNASLLTAPTLSLGYYADASQLTQTTGLVSELLAGTTNLVTWTFTGKIPHFSGYVVTSGRRGYD